MKINRYLVSLACSMWLISCGKSPQTAPYGFSPYGQPYGYQQPLQNTYPSANTQPQLTSSNTGMTPNPSLTTPQMPTNTSSKISQNAVRSGSKPVPTAPTRAGSSKSAPPKQTPTSTQVSTRQPIEQQLLGKARDAFTKVKSLSAMVETYEKNQKGPIQGKMRYIFQAPTITKVEVLDHSNSSYKGVKLKYGEDNSRNVTGRAGGLLSFMKMTLPMTDSKVTTRRNYELDQIDMAATIRRLTELGANAKVLGKMEIGGSPIAVLEFKNHQHFDPKITRELLGIDMNTNMIRMHEMYEGEELVYSIKISQLILNPPLDTKTFDI